MTVRELIKALSKDYIEPDWQVAIMPLDKSGLVDFSVADDEDPIILVVH